mmetsp:Transcript_10390/g.29585  ORF Transcript_10390/g.29585 Transcript_10390/m.29585 type:complete len:398 (-) Transcript_10390:99-1292(-)
MRASGVCVGVLLILYVAGVVSSSRDLLPLRQPITTRTGFFNVTYSGCETILTEEDLMAACNHLINPSGIVYQPLRKKIYVIGQEYILHMSEIEFESGFELTIDGCYKGDNLTLGRGDGEAAASLDFDLPEPEDPARHANWENLNRYGNYILMMEENFHEPVVYLVNVKLLGQGYIEGTAATKEKFPIPIELYPQHLEGLAFVPDLDDPIYLGTLFMGTQKGTIHSCKIPLGDPTYPVNCSTNFAQFSVHIDMLEYDPTFQVTDGAYGALVVGSESNNAAVYVDPYLVAMGQSNDVTYTEPFELITANQRALELNERQGIEGMHVYGDRVFFAVDRNYPRVQGAVMCFLTKPPSWAKRTYGWHPAQPPPHFKPSLPFYSRRGQSESESGLVKVQSSGS